VEAKKAVFIDVNGSKSYAKGHVPGALDYAAIEANLVRVLYGMVTLGKVLAR
jgi:hypothetical protein